MMSVRGSARLFVASASILLALSACSYVTQGDYDSKLKSLDEDGDGCTKGEGDCDDANPFECQDFEEIPYDGWDNDCGGDGDLVDIDGDGFPGISRDEWEANNPDPKRAEWPTSVVDDAVDCADDPTKMANAADIFPDAIDPPYDGIDSDCGGDNDFDADGDGYMPYKDAPIDLDDPEGLTVGEAYQAYLDTWGYDLGKASFGDCNDQSFNENPGFSAEEDIWYDGIDKNCDGVNDFDQDGDGQMPIEDWILVLDDNDELDFGDDGLPGTGDEDAASGRTFGEAYDDFIARYWGADDPPWGVGVFGDCLDWVDDVHLAGVVPKDVYDGAPDTPYDGLNNDCDVTRNDFDNDLPVADGYRIITVSKDDYEAYLARSRAMFGEGVVPDTLPDDCDDTNNQVYPGHLEALGDAIDQDCDGSADATPFAFGDMRWSSPRRAVVGASSAHFALTTVSGTYISPQATFHDDVGITIFFPLDAGYSEGPASQVIWQGAGTAYPIGYGVDMIADGAIIYVATSYYRTNNNTYLITKKMLWNGQKYDPTLVFDGALTGNDDYLDVDIRASGNANNDYWIFAAGANTLHYITADALGWLGQASAYVSIPGGGGTSAFVEPNTIGPSLGTVCNGTACTSYDLDDGSINSISLSSTQPWSAASWVDTEVRDGWLIGVENTTGVHLEDLKARGTGPFDLLGSDKVLSADAAWSGSDLYLAVIVEDTSGDRSVQLHYGDPSALSVATFDFNDPNFDRNRNGEPDGRSLTPKLISVFVNTDRVMIAVSGVEASGTHADEDAIGWAFVAP